MYSAEQQQYEKERARIDYQILKKFNYHKICLCSLSLKKMKKKEMN